MGYLAFYPGGGIDARMKVTLPGTGIQFIDNTQLIDNAQMIDNVA